MKAKPDERGKNMDQEVKTKVLVSAQTLDEAIWQALCAGPLNQIPERAYSILADFLAQKFAVAYLRAAKSEVDTSSIIQDLFDECTRRNDNPKKLPGGGL
jgi:hypothetical protein